MVHVHVLNKTFHLSDLLCELCFTHLLVDLLGIAGDPCDKNMAETFILNLLLGKHCAYLAAVLVDLDGHCLFACVAAVSEDHNFSELEARRMRREGERGYNLPIL